MAAWLKIQHILDMFFGIRLILDTFGMQHILDIPGIRYSLDWVLFNSEYGNFGYCLVWIWQIWIRYGIWHINKYTTTAGS